MADWRIVDIKLPDLVVKNFSRGTIGIEGVDAIGKAGKNPIVSTRIQQAELTEVIGKTAPAFRDPDPITTSGLQLAFGDIVIPPGETLSDSHELKPGQSVIVPLSKIAYLHYVGHGRIESLELRIQIREGRRSRTLVCPVTLTSYESKGRYTFPLKGDLHLAFLPLSYVHHRASHSQEFAFDVVAAAQKGTGFTEISTPDPKKLADYGIWGSEVFAIGDGTVVEKGDRFPEARMSDPALFNAPGYTRKLLTELIGTIGFTNAVAGNYLVIDHGNGEFSVYCHLKEGSLKVAKGEKVRKGQGIAQVGNTGNSGAPHLHFQVMDSADFRTANGLPVMFEDMPASAMLVEHPIRANTLSFSDNVFSTVQ